MKQKLLPGMKLTSKDFEPLEAEIKRAFKEKLYKPLIRALKIPASTIQNAAGESALAKAIASGKVTFNRCVFVGVFSAGVSKELKALGATWDKKRKGFKILRSALSYDIRSLIDVSEARFKSTMQAIDKELQKILPEEIAGSVKSSDLFDSSLFKTDRELIKQLDGLSVMPELTPAQRRKIADEYATNLDKYIVDFAEEEILRLRDEISENVFAGNRYEAMVKQISKQYGVTARKAKFLARQETSLLVTKFRETRYTSAGVTKYMWQCVIGSPKHPVRPMHKELDRKIFTWDDPPITAPNGARNNPGEDFNCRCIARPIVEFAK